MRLFKAYSIIAMDDSLGTNYQTLFVALGSLTYMYIAGNKFFINACYIITPIYKRCSI